MARKAMIEKEKRRTKLVDLKWEKRAKLKSIIKSYESSDEEKENAFREFNKLPKNSSKIRLRNRCNLTGRSRGFLRKFGLSRLCFREMANLGLVPGVTKSSW
tara:strand:- start:67 stop:372 length:306 start_codon:yes stop_codon:yes gene_type:complete